MANGGEVRVGVERGWHQPKLSYWLRGGATREAAPVLQTRPPATNSFIPHESDRTWIHAGAGLRLGRFVTDIGLAFWQRQYRLLLDLRVATTRNHGRSSARISEGTNDPRTTRRRDVLCCVRSVPPW
jgi:hypothetical protein